ncbi:hypothetical protein K440DRAFT_619801 [Wilcoxina mikolae CBS 423.85]|nr:hypothetical protein K440DRAFT_619801 [Wilcoxina mikolae CBS 423.85]
MDHYKNDGPWSSEHLTGSSGKLRAKATIRDFDESFSGPRTTIRGLDGSFSGPRTTAQGGTTSGSHGAGGSGTGVARNSGSH